MSEKIRIAARLNEVTIVYDMDPVRSDPQFIVRVRTAKNAHINAPANLCDIKVLNLWLVKRIVDADGPRDKVSENQLDIFQV